MKWNNPCTAHWVNHWTNESVKQWINEWWNQWVNGWGNSWVDESVNQYIRINETVNQQIKEPMNQWFNDSMNQRIYVSTIQWVSESMDEWIHESMNQWFNDSMNQWINASLNQRSNESMVQRFSESMNQWSNAPRNQWINESMNLANLIIQTCSNPRSSLRFWSANSTLATVSGTFCQLHCPKCFDPLRFFLAHLKCTENSSNCKSSSRYCLVHILPTSFSKSAPIPSVFRGIEMQIELALQSGAHFADTIFQKCSGTVSYFFGIFKCKSNSRQSSAHFAGLIFQKGSERDSFFQRFAAQTKLSPQSCALFVEKFPDRAPNLLRRPLEPHYPLKHRVSRSRVFSPANSCAPEVSLCSTAPTPNCCDMMITWWHGVMAWWWHGAMTWWTDCLWAFIRNSVLFELNFVWQCLRWVVETSHKVFLKCVPKSR